MFLASMFIAIRICDLRDFCQLGTLEFLCVKFEHFVFSIFGQGNPLSVLFLTKMRTNSRWINLGSNFEIHCERRIRVNIFAVKLSIPFLEARFSHSNETQKI